jgi:hypothetical protein
MEDRNQRAGRNKVVAEAFGEGSKRTTDPFRGWLLR